MYVCMYVPVSIEGPRCMYVPVPIEGPIGVVMPTLRGFHWYPYFVAQE